MIGRIFVDLEKSLGQLTTADNQKTTLRTGSGKSFPEKSSISERDRQKRNEADQQNAAARFHRRVERRCRINSERAQRRSADHCQNVLGRVGQTSHVGVSVVAAHDVERLNDHGQQEAIDQNKFKRAEKENISPGQGDHSVNQYPANDVAGHKQ